MDSCLTEEISNFMTNTNCHLKWDITAQLNICKFFICQAPTTVIEQSKRKFIHICGLFSFTETASSNSLLSFQSF